MDSDNGGRDIPWELMREILVNLPLKSLLRFTCVCKSWRTLIRNDPDFAIRQYLNRYKSSSFLMDDFDYFVDYSGCLRGSGSSKDDEILKLYMFVLTANKTFRIVKKLEFGGAALKLRFSNFCHGIVCIRVYASSSFARAFGVVLFCNPATGEVVQVPSSANIKSHTVPGFGIGYDSVMNDYKILAITYKGYSEPWMVDVYSVCKGCWRSLHDNEIGVVQQFKDLEGSVVSNANDRILNLKGRYRFGETRYGVLSFDLADEVFRQIPFPRCMCPHWYSHELLPTSRWHACMCCSRGYHSLPENEAMDIWVLNGFISAEHVPVGDSFEHQWIKLVSIRLPEQEVVWPMNLWLNDKELFVYVRREDTVEEVFLYDLSTQELKWTGRRGSISSVGGYMESLVSIKGLMSSCSGVAVPVQHGDTGKAEGHQDQGVPEYTYECDSTFFIREVTRKNVVHWCYNFNLI